MYQCDDGDAVQVEGKVPPICEYFVPVVPRVSDLYKPCDCLGVVAIPIVLPRRPREPRLAAVSVGLH